MSIVANYSNYRLGNLKIAFVVLIVLSGWCVYDGYYNDEFIQKHTKAEGKIDDTLIFCQKFPYFGVVAAFGVAGSFVRYRKKKIEAAESELILSDGKKIPYNSIEEIDHTDFEKIGKFRIGYREAGSLENVVLSKKKWDNLDSILEHLISKIS